MAEATTTENLLSKQDLMICIKGNYFILKVIILYMYLTLCILDIFFILFCRLLIFSKSTFSKSSFGNTLRVSNSLDPDQARRFVGPVPGPNCLQNYRQTTLGDKELISMAAVLKRLQVSYR